MFNQKRKAFTMSKLIVEVCEVQSVEPHPNADRLAIATVKGWRTCIKFDPETGEADFKVGDKCIFFPPDAILPEALANGPSDTPAGRLGVRQYLGTLPWTNGAAPAGGRVRATRMRGYPSFGVITHIDAAFGDDVNWEVGTDLAEHFDVTKYEPPVRASAGDAQKEITFFHRFTDMENVGNYPNRVPEGTEVVLTEKIHGTNSRVGFVLEETEAGTPEWTFAAGSKTLRRKELNEKGERSDYWMPMSDNVKAMLVHVRDTYAKVGPVSGIVMFGEIFGAGVQDMAYGCKPGERGYRAFDIAVDGNYLDFDVKAALFAEFGVEMVPVLYRGPFALSVLREHTDGNTTLCGADKAGKFKGREGVVTTPVKEELTRSGARMMVKSVSADYLARKNAIDAE
jgi:RNA ligase (TIGR02306 family)